MPELPEVETTVRGLNRTVRGKRIVDIWTSYRSAFHLGKEDIKDPGYFAKLRQRTRGAAITDAQRRGKLVLIRLDNGCTLVVHMKMTGHFLFGRYARTGGVWAPIEDGPLRDPMNRFIRVVISFDDDTHLAFSDLRKFARISIALPGADIRGTERLGPDPLGRTFSLPSFKKALSRRKRAPIKPVLMDQTVIAGIGNIYADESLWRAGVHPLSRTEAIPHQALSALLRGIQSVLREALSHGGDSDSDYRDIDGERGRFQHFHKAYRRTGEACEKRGCSGTIRRLVIGQRSAHFCDVHQTLFR